jgi:hypothetical protein
MSCPLIITVQLWGMRRVHTKRVKIDGKPWKIKLQRPPGREAYDGLCVKDDRTIYLHPDAIGHRGIELVCHELIHARLFDIDEEAVDEIGRLAGEVCAWVAEQNEGVIV